MAEAIKEGAIELILEVTLEAMLEWTASSRFSACSLMASVWVDGIFLNSRSNKGIYVLLTTQIVTNIKGIHLYFPPDIVSGILVTM